MSQFDVRAHIKVKRIDPERVKKLPVSETVGWTALGLVIAFIYLTTKALWIEWTRIPSGSSPNGVYLPEPLNAGRKIKILAGTTQEFKVNPDKRLVLSWRNPYQCDQEVLLSYRPSDNSKAGFKTEVLTGLSGNKFFPLFGETSWQVQWQVRDKEKSELGCKNANHGAMPDNAEVIGFTETIPAPAQAKK